MTIVDHGDRIAYDGVLAEYDEAVAQDLSGALLKGAVKP